VDDVRLIAENPRRPLGRLLGEGRIQATPGEGNPGITATIGDLLVREVPPERPDAGYVVVNPFGLGVLDVALFEAVYRTAQLTGIGQRLPLY